MPELTFFHYIWTIGFPQNTSPTEGTLVSASNITDEFNHRQNSQLVSWLLSQFKHFSTMDYAWAQIKRLSLIAIDPARTSVQKIAFLGG